VTAILSLRSKYFLVDALPIDIEFLMSHPALGKGTEEKKGLGESNSFDAIRLLLAILVVYSHAFLVGGFGTEGFTRLVRSQAIAGTVAVLGFFGISGFLVTRSYDLRHDWLRFAKARLLRIVPGFYLALVVTAFVLAPLIAHFNKTSQSWDSVAAFRFVFDNLLVRVGNSSVGGVLQGMPFAGSINGALWSLFPELCCYALVLFIGLFDWIRVGRANTLVACAGIIALHGALVISPKLESIAPTLLQLTGFAPFVTAFLVGSVVYCFRDHLRIGRESAIAWCAVALCLLKFGGWSLVGPIVLPLALINAAYSFRIRIPFDLSYGIYVVHFPMLQLFAAMGGNGYGYWIFLTVSLLLTSALAMLSWHFVEHPALRLKDRGP
jgi:peptidoglycan/LPS O-acetylase OafA/YrhL